MLEEQKDIRNYICELLVMHTIHNPGDVLLYKIDTQGSSILFFGHLKSGATLTKKQDITHFTNSISLKKYNRTTQYDLIRSLLLDCNVEEISDLYTKIHQILSQIGGQQV